MNGFISRTVGAASLCAGLMVVAGCCGYYDVVDPCYPSRYQYAARKEVCEARYQQVHNGHVLEQTVWNWMFVPGSAELNPAGRDHLMNLARRRPCPDSTIYLATAQDSGPTPDIKYDTKAKDPVMKFAEDRRSLDAARETAIMNYLSAQTAGHALAFHVVVHDPAEPDLAAETQGKAITARNVTFTGNLLAAPGGR